MISIYFLIIYAPNSVDTTALAADGVTGAQIADDSVAQSIL